MFKVIMGQTEDPDSLDAIKDVIEQCRKQLSKDKPSAGILYGSTEYDSQVIVDEVNKAFPGIELIGGNTCAEISSLKGYADGTLVLVLFVSDTIEIKAIVIKNIAKDQTAGIKPTLDNILPKFKEKPSLGILIAETFTNPNILVLNSGLLSFVKVLRSELGDGFTIFGGGTSSEVPNFNKIRQIYKTEVLQDAAVMLLFAGPIKSKVGVASGWVPFTSPHSLDEAKMNVVVKVEDKTGLNFYIDYIGGAPTLIHPLAVYEDAKQDKFYLRGPFGADPASGCVFCDGEFPKGAKVRIAKSDPDKIIHATGEAAEQVNDLSSNQKYQCAFVLSCFCRRQILGTRTNEEWATLSKFIKDIPVFGFYSIGQIGPYSQGDVSIAHTETCIIALLGEKNG